MDNIKTTLVCDLSSQPYSPNVAQNNSFINVAGANFGLFAQAVYVANIQDQLTTITQLLSALVAK